MYEEIKNEIKKGNSFFIMSLPITIENCGEALTCEDRTDDCLENCRRPQWNNFMCVEIGKQSKTNPKRGNLIKLIIPEDIANEIEAI